MPLPARPVKRSPPAGADPAARAVQEDDAVVPSGHRRIIALKGVDELSAGLAKLKAKLAKSARLQKALHESRTSLHRTEIRLKSEMAKNASTQEALHESRKALRDSRDELRALSARLISLRDGERERLARDLHDDIIQHLAALAIDAETAALANTFAQEDVRHAFQYIFGRLGDISNEIRNLAHELHPAMLHHLGLGITLQRHVSEYSHRTGIRCILKTTHLPERLPIESATCLYRIVLECLANVRKHSKATEVIIEFTRTAAGLLLSIRDNGIGFDSRARNSKEGLGLISMRERAYSRNGHFSVESQPGHGTTITVETPLP